MTKNTPSRSQKSSHREPRWLYNVLHPVYALRMQLPVVLFTSPVWGSACGVVVVGGSVLPIHQRVRRWCSGEPGLLQPFVHLLLLRQAPRV